MESKQDEAVTTEEPKTACEALLDMLSSTQNVNKERVGGGSGVTSRGSLVFTPSHTKDSYGQDTNLLVRTKIACDMDLVVSPLTGMARNKHTLFVKKSEYATHVLEAKRLEENPPPPKCCIL